MITVLLFILALPIILKICFMAVVALIGVVGIIVLSVQDIGRRLVGGR